jgi:hypothetical protein
MLPVVLPGQDFNRISNFQLQVVVIAAMAESTLTVSLGSTGHPVLTPMVWTLMTYISIRPISSRRTLAILEEQSLSAASKTKTNASRHSHFIKKVLLPGAR